MKLQIKRLSADAKMPTRGSAEAACFDLYVSQDMQLLNGIPELVPTGLAMEIPNGYCIKIYGRSSMHKKGVIIQTGIVDSDYRGPIKIQAINMGSVMSVKLSKGDRIAQFMIVRLETTEPTEVDELSETERGSGGFGSTGK